MEPCGGIDRRDGVRRRVYLTALVLGIPVITAVWFTRRGSDAAIAIGYPPYILSQVWVTAGLISRRMSVRRAERVVLVATVATYLAGFAHGVLTTTSVAGLEQVTTVSSTLTIILMPMLAHVAFETAQALRVSLAILGTYVGILAVRLVPDVLAGRGEGVADHLSVVMALGAAVGLLHVIAQVKEQAAEARLTATAMEHLANTDDLTGIANRRQLQDVLDRQVSRAAEDAPLAVILLDIDHFKVVNDTYGHHVGDTVLQRTAEVLSAQMRPSSLLGRWGGEEFLVIAPMTTSAQALVLAERCRASLAAAAFPVVGTITASLGVATHVPGETAWSLMRRVDRAMYRAKTQGRDGVVYEDDAVWTQELSRVPGADA